MASAKHLPPESRHPALLRRPAGLLASGAECTCRRIELPGDDRAAYPIQQGNDVAVLRLRMIVEGFDAAELALADFADRPEDDRLEDVADPNSVQRANQSVLSTRGDVGVLGPFARGLDEVDDPIEFFEIGIGRLDTVERHSCLQPDRGFARKTRLFAAGSPADGPSPKLLAARRL